MLVVNGAEGEPISAKDHALLARTPHLVLDGARAVAEAVGARRVLVAITDPDLAEPLRRALASRPDAGLFELHGLFATDRFIAGEAGALVAALNGAPGCRRAGGCCRPSAAWPAVRRCCPTPRRYAQLAVLARLGAARYGSIGAPGEPGSTLLTVSGAVASPGVLEVPLGTSLASVAAAVGAGPSQAVLVGGYHGSWLAPDPEPVAVPRRPGGCRRDVGGRGAGFVGSDTCALAELARVTQWLADQSASSAAVQLRVAGAGRRSAALLAGQPSAAGPARRSVGRTGRLRASGRRGAVRPQRAGGAGRRGRLASGLRQLPTVRSRPAGHRPSGGVAGVVMTRHAAPRVDPAQALRIDWTRCDGHGLCAALLPQAISRDEWGYPIIDQERLGEQPRRRWPGRWPAAPRSPCAARPDCSAHGR